MHSESLQALTVQKVTNMVIRKVLSPTSRSSKKRQSPIFGSKPTTKKFKRSYTPDKVRKDTVSEEVQESTEEERN
jgi:hypothetical protein